MLKPLTITFCGVKGAGKDTAAEVVKKILQERGISSSKRSIADSLKFAAADAFDVNAQYFYDPAKKEQELPELVTFTEENLQKMLQLFNVEIDYDKHIRPYLGKVFHTGRQLLQFAGFELFAEINPNVFVTRLINQMHVGSVYLVPDLRFFREYKEFQARTHNTSYFIHNSRAEAIAKSDSHASEKELFDFCMLCQQINNNGSMSELQAEVENRFRYLETRF